MPTWGLMYWPIWIWVSAILFLPVEVYALVTNQAQNTLSEYCWHELDVTKALTFTAHGLAWWTSLVMWGFFVVAITLHIWYRSWLCLPSANKLQPKPLRVYTDRVGSEPTERL